MTVCRKACSQNRPNNAFPCVTPLLVNKKHTCLTIIKSTNKTTKASIFLQQRTCADFFSFSQTNPKTRLNYCSGHDIAPCFLLPFLHCNALSAFSPPLCGQIPLVFCELSFQGSDHLFWGPLPYFTQMHFFACAGLARSLREKCNLISQFWSCWIDIFWNRCSLKTNSIFKEKLWW